MPKTKQATPNKKKQVAIDQSSNRRLYLPKRVWYKPFTWRFTPPVPAYKQLPKARILLITVLRQIWQNKRLFGGIVIIYGLFNIVLVRGLAGSNDLVNIKNMFDGVLVGFEGKAMTALASFSYLLATSGSGSAQISGIYQYLLVLICSLAFIWALRQTLAKNKVVVRDAFYQGMYPLIPFLLVIILIGVQLLPLIASAGLYNVAISAGIAIRFWEKALFVGLFLIMGLWSLRMITSSIFAVYIVTLPDMTPLQAIRSAKELVYGRRLLLWRKLVFLPVALLLFAALVETPLILFATPLAPWMFFVLSMAALPIVHGYLYNLYREMI